MNFTIREATFTETAKIHNLIPELETRHSLFFARRIKKNNYLNLVAIVNKKIAGYMVSYDKFGDGSLYCWMTGVMTQYRRRGLLHQLMQKTIRWAKKEGYSSIKLKTRNTRREMLAYAVKHNYNIIEVIPRDDQRENRILFEKKI